MKIFFVGFAVAALLNTHSVLGACDKSKATSAAPSHFLLNEALAFDQKTNLTWNRCSVGMAWKKGKCVGEAKLMSLSEAKTYARKLGDGWRVPKIEELYSIVEQKCHGPVLNTAVFPDVKDFGEGAAPYWSSTRSKEIPSLFYYVDFISGDADGHSNGFAMAVRLVRDGQ